MDLEITLSKTPAIYGRIAAGMDQVHQQISQIAANFTSTSLKSIAMVCEKAVSSKK